MPNRHQRLGSGLVRLQGYFFAPQRAKGGDSGLVSERVTVPFFTWLEAGLSADMIILRAQHIAGMRNVLLDRIAPCRSYVRPQFRQWLLQRNKGRNVPIATMTKQISLRHYSRGSFAERRVAAFLGADRRLRAESDCRRYGREADGRTY